MAELLSLLSATLTERGVLTGSVMNRMPFRTSNSRNTHWISLSCIHPYNNLLLKGKDVFHFLSRRLSDASVLIWKKENKSKVLAIVVVYNAGGWGELRDHPPSRNAHLRNFQHYFDISLQLQYCIFFSSKAFCDSHSALKAFAAGGGAPPRTLLGELTTLPRIPSRLRRGHPLP